VGVVSVIVYSIVNWSSSLSSTGQHGGNASCQGVRRHSDPEIIALIPVSSRPLLAAAFEAGPNAVPMKSLRFDMFVARSRLSISAASAGTEVEGKPR